jgi:hypothetical protein
MGSITITGDTFEANEATLSGGCISFSNTLSGLSVDITGSTFTGNYAINGGVISVITTSALDIEFTDNIYTGNTATIGIINIILS